MKKALVLLLCLIMIVGVLSACDVTERVYDAVNDYVGDDVADDGEDDNYINNEDLNFDNSYQSDNLNTDTGNTFDLPLNEYTYSELEEFDSVNIYEMYVPANGLVEMYFSSGDGSFFVCLNETPEATDALWSESFSGGGQDRLLFRNRLGEGMYYLKVYGDDTDIVTEGFYIYPQYTDESYDSSIECEWNNTEDTATKVEIGTEMTGNINTSEDSLCYTDIDYYCLEISEEKVVRLDMRIPDVTVGSREYELSGVFGNYDVTGSDLSTIGSDFRECYTKTVRLEPGIYYFNFSWSASWVSHEESADYYFTVTEQN